MLALARPCRDLSSDGLEKDQAALARFMGMSRARVSCVTGLLHLAPDILEEVLDLPMTRTGRDLVHLRELTRFVGEPAWAARQRLWRDTLLASAPRAGATPAGGPAGARSPL